MRGRALRDLFRPNSWAWFIAICKSTYPRSAMRRWLPLLASPVQLKCQQHTQRESGQPQELHCPFFLLKARSMTNTHSWKPGVHVFLAAKQVLHDQGALFHPPSAMFCSNQKVLCFQNPVSHSQGQNALGEFHGSSNRQLSAHLTCKHILMKAGMCAKCTVILVMIHLQAERQRGTSTGTFPANRTHASFVSSERTTVPGTGVAWLLARNATPVCLITGNSA